MKMMMLTSVALAAVIAMQADVLAQGGPRQTYSWCLETREGGLPNLMCRFVSWNQCMASRVSPWDRCLPNPELTFR